MERTYEGLPETITLSYNGDPLRVVRQRDDPWFFLHDLCGILRIRSPRALARKLRSEDVRTEYVFEGDRMASQTVVNESGVYAVLMSTRNGDAPRFQAWFTGTVTPLLRAQRTTGGAADHLAEMRSVVVDATADIARQTTGTHAEMQAFLAFMERSISWTNDVVTELKGLAGIVLPETRETVAALIARIERMGRTDVAVPDTMLSYIHVEGERLAILYRPDLFEGASDAVARTAGAAKAAEESLPLLVVLADADDDRRTSWNDWASRIRA